MTDKRTFKSRFMVTLVLLTISAALTGQPRQYTPAGIPIDYFPILPWDFHKPEISLKPVADCNFTLGGFVRSQDVAHAAAQGLKVIADADLGIQGANSHRRIWRGLSDAEIDAKVKFLVETTGKSEAVIGYFIMDEPSVLDFPYLRKAVDAVKKYAPGKLAYINLFPNYATISSIDQMDSQLGTQSYEEYLERYVKEVNPQFISYDNYMVQYSRDMTNKKRAVSYYTNLLAVREVALKYNLPFWNIVSSHQIRNYTTIPSMANLLLQAYTSLAAGCDGITWYQFQQNGYNYSPVDKNQVKTSTWFYLQEVNRQIALLGNFTKNLKSTGVYFALSDSALTLPPLPGKIIYSVNCEGNMMVGEFEDQNGGKYAMIVNLELGKSLKFTLSTPTGMEKTEIFSVSDDPEITNRFSRKELNNHKNNYWLTAGEGILLRISQE